MADDLLPDPGVMASDGQLPQDDGEDSSPIQFLTTQPTLSPLPIMDDSSSDSTGDSTLTGLPATTSSNDNALDTGLLGWGESIGNSLLGAFVTNPANAATQEGVANNTAANALASSSQLFGYLILGLAVFLIFSFVEKK